jgi:parallel beta-helix repeat protein
MSQSTPKRTIKASLTCLSAGDTLYIRGGQYPEQLHSVFGTNWPSGTSWNNPVTVAGYPGETVIINPSSTDSTFDVLYLNGVQYLIFDNLTIDGANVNAAIGTGLLRLETNTSHIRVQNSVLKNSLAGNGISGPGYGSEFRSLEIFGNAGYAFYLTGPDNLVENCNLHDNQGYAIHFYHSGSFDVSNNIARNNRIWHNGWNNVNPAGSCALILSSGDNNLAYNNLILDHNGCGIQIYGYGTSNSQVYNNTIAGNVGSCIDIQNGAAGNSPAVNSIARNNICYNNGSDIIDNGRGSIISNNTSNATNPQFVNATSADFHLQATSPAIDAGLTLAIVTMDIVKVSRPQGKDYDIGAYEYVGNQNPAPSNLRVISTQK